MKMILTLLAAAVVCFSPGRPAPQQNPLAYILRNDFDNPGFGAYSFGVETSDGFRHDQIGAIANEGTSNEALRVSGEYQYMGDDGQMYNVRYTADENGFQPQGAHIPQSAGVRQLGIPSAALASLAG